MVICRGDVCWVDFGDPVGSRPAKHRPALVVQANSYNTSRLISVVVASITSNTGLATMPGNVFLPSVATGLERDSVVNVTSLITVDKKELGRPVGRISTRLMVDVDMGLRRVLCL